MEGFSQSVEIGDLPSFFRVLKKVIESDGDCDVFIGCEHEFFSTPRGAALITCCNWSSSMSSIEVIGMFGGYLLEQESKNRWFVNIFVSSVAPDRDDCARFRNLLESYFERAMEVCLVPESVIREMTDLANDLARGNTNDRRTASIKLGELGLKSAVDPLVNALLHDSDKVVRMNAALSLARNPSAKAVGPLVKTIRSYLGSKLDHSLAVASAKALGNIGKREPLSLLKELESFLKESGRREEAESVKHAILRIEGKEVATELYCPVCNQPINEDDELVKCPDCGVIAHKVHMLEWLHVKDYCPCCHHHLDQSLVKPAKVTAAIAKPSKHPGAKP